MRQKKLLVVTLVLSVLVIFNNGLGVNAAEDSVKYDNYKDISVTIQSETGDTMYLSSVEKIGDAYQAIYQDTDTLQTSANSPESARIIVHVEKEVTKDYISFDAIPTSIYYEEYNDEYQTWLKGTLSLYKAERSGSYWKATFKGTLSGNI